MNDKLLNDEPLNIKGVYNMLTAFLNQILKDLRNKKYQEETSRYIRSKNFKNLCELAMIDYDYFMENALTMDGKIKSRPKRSSLL